MIEALLERARRRADGGADALWRRTERTSVAFDWGRLKSAAVTEEAGVNLRVRDHGRVGVAGSTAIDGTGDELLTRALASAALGDAVALAFPPARPLPALATFATPAADAPLDRLIAVGRAVLERLERDGCRVNVTVEREITETRVGNSSGASATYRATTLGVSAELWRIAGDDVLVVGDSVEGTELPSDEALETLVRSINARLEPALRVVAPPDGALPVVFTPAGLSAVLLPLTQGLSGKAVLQGISPLADKVGKAVFDARFTLTDDPLHAGRPASRPIDDECVPSRTTGLVEEGIVRRFIYDLETAARANTESTGHGHRSIFGRPTLGYTNLLVGPASAPAANASASLGGGLVEEVSDGLLVDELIGVGQGNVIGGAFSHPVALAYRIERGAITGRVKDAAVAGNAYELWKRVGGFGHDTRWTSGRYAPSVLFNDVSVARR